MNKCPSCERMEKQMKTAEELFWELELMLPDVAPSWAIIAKLKECIFALEK